MIPIRMGGRWKILSVVGTRPNFMKVAPIAGELGRREEEFEHVLVHTGQHYDANMSSVFFEERPASNTIASSTITR